MSKEVPVDSFEVGLSKIIKIFEDYSKLPQEEKERMKRESDELIKRYNSMEVVFKD